jgi:hypothetical protein
MNVFAVQSNMDHVPVLWFVFVYNNVANVLVSWIVQHRHSYAIKENAAICQVV